MIYLVIEGFAAAKTFQMPLTNSGVEEKSCFKLKFVFFIMVVDDQP